MNISISYNGSVAICKLDGKPIKHATAAEVAFAMGAFRTIEKAYARKN